MIPVPFFCAGVCTCDVCTLFCQMSRFLLLMCDQLSHAYVFLAVAFSFFLFIIVLIEYLVMCLGGGGRNLCRLLTLQPWWGLDPLDLCKMCSTKWPRWQFRSLLLVWVPSSGACQQIRTDARLPGSHETDIVTLTLNAEEKISLPQILAESVWHEWPRSEFRPLPEVPWPNIF